MSRRLVVNADDFGGSAGINEAVEEAHRNGVLTSASLMVTGGAVAEAVQIARRNPNLGVGLHLVLLCGRAAAPASIENGLADSAGHFSDDPIGTGFRYYFRKSLRAALEEEIEEQFKLFRETGLVLDHVNGHLNLHLHPVIFDILLAERFAVPRMRWTLDPFWLNARLAGGRWLYRASHALVFQVLGRRARPALLRRGVRHCGRVFGLLQNGRVDEDYIVGLLSRLPEGDSELYSHPSTGQFRHEYEALMSPRVRQAASAGGIQLIRYQDL